MPLITAYAGYRVWRSGWDWVLVAWAGLTGAGLFALGMGSAYFLELGQAGRGGFDLLLTPEPRTIFLLVAAVGLAPVAVGGVGSPLLPDAAIPKAPGLFWPVLWMGLVLLDAVGMQRANWELFRVQFEALGKPVHAVHVSAIERALGRKKVALADTFPWRAREQMLRDGVLAPTSFMR